MRLNPKKCTFGVRAGKFLGFYLTEWGIEANPDKCRPIAEMRPPTTKKDIQKLTGMITFLSRFVSQAAKRSQPFFKLLKKGIEFEWNEECEQALPQLKVTFSEPPILIRPLEGRIFYLYLVVYEEALSSVLVRETQEGKRPVYFVSKALKGVGIRYKTWN